jgi:hypothetical protein
MRQLFLTIIFFLLGLNATHARLFLDVSILNKKGIDIGLTLGSELHSIEEVRHNEDIILRMRSGVKIVLQASFIEEGKDFKGTDEYGPSSKILVKGKILDSQNKVLKDFTNEPVVISLEEEKKVIHSQESQLVEVTLKPHLN